MRNIPFEEMCSVRLPREVQKKRLQRVIREELTENQRQVLLSYYYRRMTLEAIARERGVNKSTVCRTLKRAEGRLRRFLKY